MLQVTLPTNFKVARFDVERGNEIVRQLEKEIDAIRFEAAEGKLELPVKLRFYDSVFVPLAKWPMLLAGNYRCITDDGMRTAKEAVHTDLEASRSIYDFVIEVCTKIGASRDDLVPFEKYAAAANDLSRPASAARALSNGARQHRARGQAGAARRKPEWHEASHAGPDRGAGGPAPRANRKAKQSAA